MRISDWSSDVCSSDLGQGLGGNQVAHVEGQRLDDQHQPENGQQNRQRAGQGVDEEGERCTGSIAVAPAADEEIHTDQREVEEDVEDQPVERQEDDQRGALKTDKRRVGKEWSSTCRSRGSPY